MCRHKRKQGWLLTETAVTLFLLGVFFFAIISATGTFGKLNYILLKKQQCLAAARAQLESIIATGKPIEQHDIEQLWPDIELIVDTHKGQGDWAGLDLCTVTAKTKIRKRYVEMKLSRYYPPPREY